MAFKAKNSVCQYVFIVLTRRNVCSPLPKLMASRHKEPYPDISYVFKESRTLL
jgi:hypothetical protein